MANMKQMDIIKRGVDTWNTWRANNAHVLPSLSDAGLHMAYLNKANLSRADLADAGLRLADLIEANLKGADLYWANLSEANLRGANLRGANLQGANMTGSNLRSASMNSANMGQANISRADMTNAELIRANLYSADLNGADLSGAVLKDANLIGANLTGTNLDGADLSNAIVGGTILGNVDLSNVKGLETLMHLGPSTVGIDTIYKSKGKVPVNFLKSAGVPRQMIDYIELFIDPNEKYFSCFISYTEKDEEFTFKLCEDLRNLGIRCWLATDAFMRRNRSHAIFDSAVKLHDKIIMILSENSIDKDWIENEYVYAIQKEMQSGVTSLVPISLDDAVACSEKPWATKMRRLRYIYDFSTWQENDSYEESLSYLIAGLNAEEEAYDDTYDYDYLPDEAAVDQQESFAQEDDDASPEEMAQEFRSERRQFC